MMYRIRFISEYGNTIYSYRKEDNICGLAKFLNERAEKFPRDYIEEVEVAEDYNVYADGVAVNFLPIEYIEQRFIETYEERLIAYHEHQNLVPFIV